jgi:NAD(P)-dependent dehydrogenase (short-subunit alcohol dehydrogenase family)
MVPPSGSKTAQGYELQLGVNNLGTFLFTKLLTPTLARTASIEDPSSVRVVWVSSSAAESIQVPSGGIDISNLDYHVDKSPFEKYCVSKAGNYLQGAEFARRHKDDGIVSVPLNPGNLSSDLWRSFGSGAQSFLRSFVLHPPILGAYTQLFAAFSPQVSIERSGEWGKSLCWLVDHCDLRLTVATV